MVTSKEYKKAFTFGTTLTKHINVIHGGERNFKCVFCDKLFSQLAVSKDTWKNSMKMANFCNVHFDNKIKINSIVSERRIVIFYTEILTGKVVLWCFFLE